MQLIRDVVVVVGIDDVVVVETDAVVVVSSFPAKTWKVIQKEKRSKNSKKYNVLLAFLKTFIIFREMGDTEFTERALNKLKYK